MPHLDLSKYIFIDNHAHSLLKRHMELDTFGFRQCFSESRSREIIENHLPTSIHYLDMVNKMSSILATDDEESLIMIRSRQQEAGYVRTLWDDVSIGALIIDDGFLPTEMMTIAQLSAVAQRPTYGCRRIETVLEACITKCSTFAELGQQFQQNLFDTAKEQLIALKTIAAYRGGLQIDIVAQNEAEKDFDKVKADFKNGYARLDRCPLYHYFLMQAFELAACHSLPVQIHCGLGDDDALLTQSNPALLQPLFKMSTLEKTDFILLHCFPYVKEAGILSALYPNVYMDLSLSMSLAAPNSKSMIIESLATAPASKLLAGSDGHSCPEAHWYGALRWKTALTAALSELIAEKLISEEQAHDTAALILHGNAKRLYHLEGMA